MSKSSINRVRITRIATFPGLLILISGLISLNVTSVAQSTDPGSSGSMVGLLPNTSQHGDQIESVNTLTGALHIEIPISSTTLRGRAITTKYVYNTPAFHADFVPNPDSNGRDPGYWQVHTSDTSDWSLNSSPGTWGLIFDSPDLSSADPLCAATTNDPYGTIQGTLIEYKNFAVIDPSGAKHPLDLYYSATISGFPGSNDLSYTTNPFCSPGVYATSGWTLDGSGVFVDLGAGTIRTKDGALVSQGTPWTVQTGPFSSSTVAGVPWGGQFTDSNGNQLPSAPLGATTGTISTGSQTQTIYDAEGNAQSLIITYESVAIQTNDCPALAHYLTAGNTCTDITPAITLPYIHKITLPNGLYYQFEYAQNSHGELTSVRLPTGATVSYEYGPMFIDDHNPRLAPIYEHPVINKRTISDSGVSSVWLYTTDVGNSEMTIQDPIGNCEVHSTSLLGGLRPVPAETDVNYFAGCDTTGTPLKAVHTDYAFEHIGNDVGQIVNMRPIRVTTTIDGVSSKVETDYETFTIDRSNYILTATLLNPTEVREFDYGASTPTRITDYTYLHNVGSAAATAAQYKALNIADRILTKTTKGGGACVSPMFCQTKYEYDNYTAGLQSEPQAALHDDADYGSSNVIRGNVTSVSGWNSTNNNWLTTRFQYDNLGNKVSSQDPKGNTTTMSFADSFSDQACARPNKSIYGMVTTLTNAFGETTAMKYSSCTGMLKQVQDANDLAQARSGTVYSYDAVNSLVGTSYPDGGSVTVNYNGYALPITVTTTTTAAPDPPLVSSLTYDGLGRPTIATAPSGATTVTTYDVDGNVSSVTNPFFSKSESTYGVTSYAYDALGRKTVQCQPDNGNTGPCAAVGSSFLKWTYSGNVTAQQDELGNSWRRTSDALGHLTNIVEPTGTSTNYGYDVLGNLATVTQTSSSDGTRSRSFYYDSLSRLVAANNPENATAIYPAGLNCVPGGPWTTCYTYDPNGNLQTKTDNRNVITTYSYDPLNRLTGKTYSTSDTLSSCYQYGTLLSANTVPNSIGRLVSEWTQPDTCSTTPASNGVPSSAVNWKLITNYDPMSRIRGEQQCPLGPCTSPVTLSYAYDLAGNLISSTNGMPSAISSSFLATYTTDTGGNLKKIFTTWNDAAHPPTLFQADQPVTVAGNTYAPYGPFGLTGAQYGINPTEATSALLESRSYDIRGRLITKNVLGTNASMSTTVTVSMSPAIFDLTSAATITVHVNCNSACGQIDLKADSNDLGAQTLDASGNVSISSSTFPASALSVGSHTVTVLYLGNGSYPSSSSSTTYTVTAQQTTVDFSMSQTVFTTAENPPMSMHVSCNSACGQVALTVDGHNWIPGNDVDGSGNFFGGFNIWFWPSPYLIPGTHTITANYLGDSTYAPSSKSVTVTINPIGTQQTGVSLSIDPTAFATVQDAVASVNVTCGSACGQVLFTIDGNNWVIWNLDANGNTSADTYWWPNPYFTQGTHTLSANYLGNSTYAPSSASQTITVTPIGTQPVSVTVSANTTTYSPTAPFYVPIQVGCNSACGLVLVTVDGNQWAILHLDETGSGTVGTSWAGDAYFRADDYFETTHIVTAHFLGNSTYAPADSSLTITVPPAK